MLAEMIAVFYFDKKYLNTNPPSSWGHSLPPLLPGDNIKNTSFVNPSILIVQFA